MGEGVCAAMATMRLQYSKRTVNEFGAVVILLCCTNKVDENRIWLKISWQKENGRKWKMGNGVS